MIIHDRIEFHNCAELTPRLGLPGLSPQRFPEAVQNAMPAEGRLHASDAAGVELRFVTDAPIIKVSLCAHEADVEVHVYRGEYGHSDHRIPAGTIKVLNLNPPPRFLEVSEHDLLGGSFSPGVWRIWISRGPVSYLGIETFGHDLRPPSPEEKPARCWLAYGSSITHAWAGGYPHRTAQMLGIDVLNKGLSGSCLCEAEIADHFAENKSWDFATLELGINMRGRFTADEFRQRAGYLIDQLRQKRPEAPVVLITHFSNVDHYKTGPSAEHQSAYDDFLRERAGVDDPNLHLIEGRELLPDLNGLGCDLIHPSETGQLIIARHLALRLKQLLG